MSDFIDYDSEPPFANVDSVLYVETERNVDRRYRTIDNTMTPDRLAAEIAEVFPDNYQLILIIKALGEVKL